ncbi:MAG: sigma-54-dependent transcriptional regulator [Treponema sp.]
MQKGIIIFNSIEKYKETIKSTLSSKYLLHFSSKIDFLSHVIISGEISFIAFDPETRLIDFIKLFNKIKALYHDLPVFLISETSISLKTKVVLERFISYKITKSFCLDTDFDNFIETLNSLPERDVNEKKDINFLYTSLIGESENTEELRLFISSVSKTNKSVILLGETGCGKTTVAKLIHDLSKRRDKRFVNVDIGTIPDDLIETILFGAKKGSYTGAYENTIGLIEEANRGTLFLDEIENMPMNMQIKLLRALDTKRIREVGGNTEKYVDFRLICASNCNLLEMVRKGSFRQDLYYRINISNFNIKPLRERKEDVELLAKFYVEKHNFTISPEALKKLHISKFEGNIRELFNVLENAFLLASPLTIIYPEHIIFMMQ